MSNTNTADCSSKKKGSAGKTFLSVLFFILILACALVLSVCMIMRTQSGAVLGVYSDIMGSRIVDFLTGDLCFWCAVSAVVLWFGLWLVTTRRIASAIRGLGIACAIAALAVLLGELVTMLLVCLFKMQSDLTPFADILPSQFADGCGDNVIFLLSSVIIASVGIFICKLRKLPKKSAAAAKSESTPSPAPAPEPAPVPEPAIAAAPVQSEGGNITNIDIDVSEPKAAPESAESLIQSLEGVCHMCGKKNEPGVKFCGGCGAKLI